MAKSYYGMPLAVTSITATNANSLYPVTNAIDYDPANPFKAASTTVSVTLYHANAARHYAALINHNLVGATSVAVGGVAVTVPSRTPDGQCVNPITVLSLGAGTSTTVVVTGATSAVALGAICLISSLAPLNWAWGGPTVDLEAEWPVNEITTFGGSTLRYNKGYRVRRARGILTRESHRTQWETLAQTSQGRNVPFVFVPDLDVNDAWYVLLGRSGIIGRRRMTNASVTDVELEELSMGLPL
jgi:hypothetical protein